MSRIVLRHHAVFCSCQNCCAIKSHFLRLRAIIALSSDDSHFSHSISSCPYLTSPYLDSSCLTVPHRTSPRLTIPHLTSPTLIGPPPRGPPPGPPSTNNAPPRMGTGQISGPPPRGPPPRGPPVAPPRSGPPPGMNYATAISDVCDDYICCPSDWIRSDLIAAFSLQCSPVRSNAICV